MTTDIEVIVPVEDGCYWYQSNSMSAPGLPLNGVSLVKVEELPCHANQKYRGVCFFSLDQDMQPTYVGVSLDILLQHGTFLHKEPLTPPGE